MNVLKLFSRRTFVLMFLMGFIVVLASLFYFSSAKVARDDSVPSTEDATVLPMGRPARASLPARLVIPSLGIDAPVESVGLTSDGAMDVPKGPTTVAWFDLGSRPGEIGSAVITGHYGWKEGKASVFDTISQLRAGDKVEILDDEGVRISFVVRESRRYDPDADALGVFRSDDGKSHLNLITCEGVWDKVTKSYSTRLVVFADKEE